MVGESASFNESFICSEVCSLAIFLNSLESYSSPSMLKSESLSENSTCDCIAVEDLRDGALLTSLKTWLEATVSTCWVC
jgi:hypothetical protein